MSEFTLGDIVEIKTDHGLAYVQVTHDHPSYPPAVRALPGLHDTRPDDLVSLASEEARFTAMIPLQGALKKLGLDFDLADHADIPEAGQSFPTFRMPIRDKQGNIVYWWFWDGRGLSYSTELDPEQNDMSLRDVMSAEQFHERLVNLKTQSA